MSRRLGRRIPRRILPGLAVVALLVGCAPSPSPTPSPPPPSPSPVSGFTAASLALEACDPSGDVPCEQQAATIRLPIAGSGAALTYSSEWAPGRTDRPRWDPASLGLGGWSLDILARYDAADGIVLDGDGSWRLAQPLGLPNGELVVASYDGRRADVFDAAGRELRRVDPVLGVTLVTFDYDAAGRLVGMHGSRDNGPVELSVERAADGTPRRLVGMDDAATDLALDSNGHLTWVRDPAGGTASAVVTTEGLVTSFTDAAGGTSRYAYDDAGRLSSATDPDGVTLRYERSATPDRSEVRVTTPSGASTSHRVERAGTTVSRSLVAPGGATTTLATEADGSGTLTLADGTREAFGLVPDPRFGLQAPVRTPLTITRPDGTTRKTEIGVTSAAGDLLRPADWSRTTAVDGQTWTEMLDPAARTITTTDPDGRRSTVGVDDAGRLVLATQPGRAEWSATYDAEGRLATETIGRGPTAATSRYAYDPATGKIAITRPDGSVEQVAVDAIGQIVRGTAADGTTVQLGYDPAGRLIQVRPADHPSSTLGRSAGGRSAGFLAPALEGDPTVETHQRDGDGRIGAILAG